MYQPSAILVSQSPNQKSLSKLIAELCQDDGAAITMCVAVLNLRLANAAEILPLLVEAKKRGEIKIEVVISSQSSDELAAILKTIQPKLSA